MNFAINAVCLKCGGPFRQGSTPNGGFMAEVRCYADGVGPYHGACMNDCKSAIASELYTALERLGADPDLLSIVGSWNDTATDTEVLRLLQDYNKTGKVIHERQ